MADTIHAPLNLALFSRDSELLSCLHKALSPSEAIVTVMDGSVVDESALATVDGALVGSISPELRAKMPKLRWVQFWSAGVDGKLFPELFSSGAGADSVTVCTGAGIHVDSCANHVMAQLLALARGLPQSFAAQQKRDWGGRSAIVDAQFELDGKTMAIVGTGAIGQAIALRAKAFGVRTIGVRRHADRPAPGFDVVVPLLQYHEALLDANFIVLALPLTSNTRWIFGEDEVEIVKKGTYLFNIGRGGLIDDRYVFTALKNRWLAGAGLDVFEDEPLPPDSPWWTLDNVIVTPHVGGNTPEYWPRFARLIARQVAHLRAGDPLENRVSRELGY